MKAVHFRTGKHEGLWNMAFDKYLMEQVRDGRWSFVLRTYGWEPACVSIGKLQNRDSEINCDLLLRDGFNVVRRPTGGRAVWHETELTYSIVAGIEHPLVSGSISEALMKVSVPMVKAMNILDIPVSVSSTDRHRTGGPRMRSNPCFTSHGKWEVGTPDGRKLVGSAQARSRGVFLEHGSILFLNDQMKILDYLPHTTSTHHKNILAHHLKEGIACIWEFKPDLKMLDMENALHSSFKDVLGEDLHYSDFEALDRKRLNELLSECRNEIQKKT
ncbi:MAG: lipoate--protein ligase family protein [Candidatus Aegiribacteria sp.]|nr:lipoate--protein ligase family protein [Candidatus Aegiribacteria sp.]